jgi:hypothetical protein
MQAERIKCPCSVVYTVSVAVAHAVFVLLNKGHAVTIDGTDR